jgi:dienelactone hydrolase
MERVGNGTAEDWYREWTRTAERVYAIARTSEEKGHAASAREAYFRASAYYHASYFPLFGAPVDPWLADAFERETDAFHRGARLSESPVEPVEIPFEKKSLPGYFLHSHSDLWRPTLLQVSGYDSNIQEMYFAHGLPVLRQGYNYLLLDGPGQGRNLIRDNIPLRPDWETVVRAAVDYLLTRPEVDPTRIVLVGWGFGAVLAQRAAACEKRIAALIAIPDVWDQHPHLSAFNRLPQIVLNFPESDPPIFDAVERQLRASDADSMTRWKILQCGMWVHRVDSLYELARELTRFEINGITDNISCPKLIVAAGGTGSFCKAPCGCPHHQHTFEWLDTTLAMRNKRGRQE